MNVVSMIVGLVLLLFGRRLFWFFVAAAGFAVGMVLARDAFQLESEVLILAVALLGGVIGALLSILMQKAAVAIAGFAGGGYLGAVLLRAVDVQNFAWLGFLIGGIVGAILLLTVFEWALIGISALMGAALVSQFFTDQTTSLAVFAASLVLGIVAQALQLTRGRDVKRTAAATPGKAPS